MKQFYMSMVQPVDFYEKKKKKKRKKMEIDFNAKYV